MSNLYEEVGDAVRFISSRADSDLSDYVGSFGQQYNSDNVRNAMIEFFPQLVQTYGDDASVIASDFYSLARIESGVKGDAPSPPEVNLTSLSEAAVIWAAGSLFSEGGIALFLSQLSGAVDRLVLSHFRGTVDALARADAVRGSVSVGWRRKVRKQSLASGKACDFCKRHSGQGTTYYVDGRSKVSVNGGRWHNGCSCDQVVVFLN